MVTSYKSAQHFSTWKRRTAAIGLFGGLAAPVAGSILSIITWFADPAWHGLYLHVIATTLFVIAFPLLILGAHCLDLLDKDRQTATNVWHLHL
jgi:hypothetical protein